jgi:hypothetical protein
MRSDVVVVTAPAFDDDLRLFQRVEDFSVEQPVSQFCSDIAASRQTAGAAFP